MNIFGDYILILYQRIKGMNLLRDSHRCVVLIVVQLILK